MSAKPAAAAFGSVAAVQAHGWPAGRPRAGGPVLLAVAVLHLTVIGWMWHARWSVPAPASAARPAPPIAWLRWPATADPPAPEKAAQRRPATRRATAVRGDAAATAPPTLARQPPGDSRPWDDAADSPLSGRTATPAAPSSAVPPPAVEAAHRPLDLHLTPEAAASAAGNPALRDERSNTRPLSYAERFADTLGSAETQVEVTPAGRRYRRGATCWDEKESLTARNDPMAPNAAFQPRLVGEPYRCR